MNNEYKREKFQKQLRQTIKREQRRNYIILYVVTLLILFVLVMISFGKGYFSGEDFIENIINNIIGIIPPLLIFDFFHEKLSRDASAIEMSNKITETLMSNPEMLELFTEEQRKNFICSTIESIVKDEETTDMISSNLHNYLFLNPDYRLKTSFDYDFVLEESLPEVYNEMIGKDQYLYVQERLNYRVKYLSSKSNKAKTNEIKIGFVFDNKSLDNCLRDKKSDPDFDHCIFRENLDILKEDIDFFKRLSGTELKAKFQAMFKLDVRIDGCKGEIKEVIVKESGIVVKMFVGHNVHATEHIVRIIFHMPKRWDSLLEVALMDPTHAPKISVSYPEDKMNVEMFSFLSKGEETSLETAHEQLNGIYDIAINNEWIYPISGIIFMINKKRV